eukprot:Opistho-2@33304
MSNAGKFRDMRPDLRTAGKLSGMGQLSARDCIEPNWGFVDESSLSPSSRLRAPGQRRTVDPYAESMTHGVRSNVVSEAGDLLNPRPASEFFRQLEEHKEQKYKRAIPLGRSVCAVKAPLPPIVGQADFAFGIVNQKGEGAFEVIFPQKNAADPEAEETARRLYRRSHGDFDPGEQRDRNYSAFPREGRFGVPTPHSNAGLMTRESLRWSFDESALRRSRRYRELGKVHDPMADMRRVGPEHAFGVPNPTEPFHAGDLLHGRFPEAQAAQQQEPEGETPEERRRRTRSLSPRIVDGRIFGVPSRRTDISAPAHRSLADPQNYGDDLPAYDLMNPSLLTSRGLDLGELHELRSKEQMLDIMSSIGIGLSPDEFARAWQVASAGHSSGMASIRSFQEALETAPRSS